RPRARSGGRRPPPSGSRAAGARDRGAPRASRRDTPSSPRGRCRASARSRRRARAWRGRSPRGRSPARGHGPSPPAPAPARRASLLPRLHVQVRAREGAAAVLEELDVAEPATVGTPLLLQADRRRQRLLDGAERLHVALHREVLDRKARALQRGARLVLAPGKARAPAGLFPLVGVKGNEGERRAASERAAGALGD